MAKNKISEYSATAANNTDVANINIAEGCSPSNINNAIRGVMAHLKDFQAGNQTGNALAVAGGGTGAENATDARTNLSAAKTGANSDITSLTGLTTALSTTQGGTALTSFTSGGAMYATSTSALTTGTLPVASGGTGATTLTANNVLLGNGTSAPQAVAPGTSGNVLTSNGTTWTSATPATAITRETEKATTSGTSVEWTSLPSTITKITVVFNDMGAGTDAPIVQLGDSGGYKTTGYVGVGANIDPDPSRLSVTTGLATCQSNNGEHIIGNMVISNVSGDTWISSFNGLEGTTDTILGNSRITLSGTLDRLKVTTISGTTLDNGSVNIIYE
jgi:hypothetical protein